MEQVQSTKCEDSVKLFLEISLLLQSNFMLISFAIQYKSSITKKHLLTSTFIFVDKTRVIFWFSQQKFGNTSNRYFHKINTTELFSRLGNKKEFFFFSLTIPLIKINITKMKHLQNHENSENHD